MSLPTALDVATAGLASVTGVLGECQLNSGAHTRLLPLQAYFQIVVDAGGDGSTEHGVATNWAFSVSDLIAVEQINADIIQRLLGDLAAATDFQNDPYPVSIELVSGDEQTAGINTTVADDAIVLVRDQNGDPLGGFGVNFVTTLGGMEPEFNPTASDDGNYNGGQALLGGTIGAQSMTASVEGYPAAGSVVFTATGEAAGGRSFTVLQKATNSTPGTDFAWSAPSTAPTVGGRAYAVVVGFAGTGGIDWVSGDPTLTGLGGTWQIEQDLSSVPTDTYRNAHHVEEDSNPAPRITVFTCTDFTPGDKTALHVTYSAQAGTDVWVAHLFLIDAPDSASVVQLVKDYSSWYATHEPTSIVFGSAPAATSGCIAIAADSSLSTFSSAWTDSPTATDEAHVGGSYQARLGLYEVAPAVAIMSSGSGNPPLLNEPGVMMILEISAP